MQELDTSKTYREFTSVSIFPYLEGEEGTQLIFLKDNKTGELREIRGRFSSSDTSIVITAVKAMLKDTCGALTSDNILGGPEKPFQPLKLLKNEHYNCNLIFNEPCFGGLLTNHLENAQQIELKSGIKVYSVPINRVNIEEINAYLHEEGQSFELCSIDLDQISQSAHFFNKMTRQLLDVVSSGFFSSITRTMKKSGRSYAVVSCRAISRTQADTNHLYNHCEALLHGHFRRADENWYEFNAPDGEFPDASLLEQLDGIIVPGAPGHCYDKTLDWIPGMEKFVQHVYNNTEIRYLGLCYGAQILAQSLGGKVAKMEHVVYRAGNDDVTIDEKFYELPYVKSHKKLCSKKPTTLTLVKSHGDYIKKLPAGAVLLGSSVTTKNEIFAIGNRFLATQGHPEYTSDFTCSRGSLLKISEIGEEEIEEYEKTKAQRKQEDYGLPESRFDLLTVCTNFLKKIE